MRHYTFKLHLADKEALVEGGSVGTSFEAAVEYFCKQPQVIDFLREHGPVEDIEFVSEESLEEATPELARSKGMESLALATENRIIGDIIHDAIFGEEDADGE